MKSLANPDEKRTKPMTGFFALRALQTEEEYEAALKAVRPYFENEPADDTLEAADFDTFVLRIELYEERHDQLRSPHL